MTVWKTATIGSVCTTFSGGTPSTSHPEYYGGDIAWIASADLNQGRIRSVKGRITRVGLERSSAKLVKSGTPLIALYGATAGVPAITYVDGAINQAILAMIPRAIESEYFFQWLQANRESIIDRYTQGGQPNLSGAIVRNIEIPLPPVSEQRRIGEVLGNADNLIAELERLITKKQAIKQGMMQELLTGRTRLPGFAGKWHRRPLAELLSYEQPTRYLVKTVKQLDSGRIPVLTAGKTFVLGYTNDSDGVYTSHPVIIFDDFTTASQYVDFDFKVKSSAMKILTARPGVDLRFVYERIQLIEFPLGDHKRYWISEYGKQEIEVPTKAEQTAISQIIADSDRELTLLDLRLAKARAIKQGMMQELLTGRTRLPVSEAAA